MFSADVCSFKCAEALTSGGWRELPEYSELATEGARLVRAELHVMLGEYVRIGEAAVVAAWESGK